MSLASRLALGTVQFGLPYGISNSSGKVHPDAVSEILRLCVSHGITTLDTASAYGDSEQVLGESLLSLVQRDQLQIVTKLSPTPTGSVRQELEGSLRRLKVSMVDGYLFHHFQTWADRPALWGEMLAVKKAGLAHRVGFSLYTPQELEALWDAGISPDLIQVPYSVLDQRFAPLFEECRARGTAIHTRSVFLQGLVFLETNQVPPFFDAIRPNLEWLRTTALDLNVELSLLCLAFPYLNEHIERVLIGVESVANLHQNLKLTQVLEPIRSANLDWSRPAAADPAILLPMNWPKTGMRKQ